MCELGAGRAGPGVYAQLLRCKHNHARTQLVGANSTPPCLLPQAQRQQGEIQRLAEALEAAAPRSDQGRPGGSKVTLQRLASEVRMSGVWREWVWGRGADLAQHL